MSKIISHEDPEYVARRTELGPKGGMYNGAYYYLTEIVKNIIPRVATNRPWVTVNIPGKCYDGAIFFAHKNTNFERYEWLRDYTDLVIVCSTPTTYKHMATFGTPIYLPLSVDVNYVKQFIDETPRGRQYKNCYCGNMWTFKLADLRHYLPPGTKTLTAMPREEMLKEMAKFQNVYAVGRCAIEAKILGKHVGVCDHRYPDPNFWRVIDNYEAAMLLQEKLDCLDDDSAKV